MWDRGRGESHVIEGGDMSGWGDAPQFADWGPLGRSWVGSTSSQHFWNQPQKQEHFWVPASGKYLLSLMLLIVSSKFTDNRFVTYFSIALQNLLFCRSLNPILPFPDSALIKNLVRNLVLALELPSLSFVDYIATSFLYSIQISIRL